jgi:hypothetical protein
MAGVTQICRTGPRHHQHLGICLQEEKQEKHEQDLHAQARGLRGLLYVYLPPGSFDGHPQPPPCEAPSAELASCMHTQNADEDAPAECAAEDRGKQLQLQLATGVAKLHAKPALCLHCLPIIPPSPIFLVLSWFNL